MAKVTDEGVHSRDWTLPARARLEPVPCVPEVRRVPKGSAELFLLAINPVLSHSRNLKGTIVLHAFASACLIPLAMTLGIQQCLCTIGVDKGLTVHVCRPGGITITAIPGPAAAGKQKRKLLFLPLLERTDGNLYNGWKISNPEADYCVFPTKDDASGRIAALEVWVK